MKKIRMPDWKIKWMLLGLVFMSIVLILILSVLSYVWAIPKLTKSQDSLKEIVTVQEHYQKIEASVKDLIIHMYSVILKERGEQSPDKKHLIENEFDDTVNKLNAALKKFDDTGTEEKTKNLAKSYKNALSTHNEISESVEKRLNLEDEIKGQIATLDKEGAKSHKNTETFSEKIDIAIRKHVSKQAANLPNEKSEALLNELKRTQKTSNNLRLAVALLTNYGRQILTAADKQQIAGIKAEIATHPVKNIEKAMADLKKKDMDSAELSELVQNMETGYNLLKSTLIEGNNSIAVLRGRWLTEQRNNDNNAILTSLVKDLREKLEALQTDLNTLRKSAKDEVEDVKNKAALYILIIISLVAVFIMMPIGWLIIRRIISPINKLVSFADSISQGDLTVEIEKEHNDEVGYLTSKLSDMASNLNALIGQVQRSGIQVTSSATELSATSKQQEAVMKTQLESTNYVVNSIGEISNVSEELVETMQKVAAMSEQTADFASRGQTDLAQMEEAMRHMEDASKSISGKLEAINEKAANITSVVTTITKVADQTNLLSLNAAIEAEKAGEYGRGFTVVAREIRRLADQTAVATLDIEQMVQEMQSAVSAGVMEMDAFITEVQQSAENVGKISTQLSRIIEQVQALTPSFEGVNESMQFQAGSAQQINSSMVNLSEEMQQTVESLRESFMAIEQLNDAARGLQDEVSRFKVMY